MQEAQPFENHAPNNWHMEDSNMTRRYEGAEMAATKVARLLHQKLAA